MKQFIVCKNKVKVNSVQYDVINIEIEKSKDGILVPHSNKNIKKAGVYIFVLKRDCENFNLKEFSKEVTGTYYKNNGDPYLVETSVPKINYKNISKLESGNILYVGKKGNIYSRVREHMVSNTINGNASLKLGFKSREYIKEYINIFAIIMNNKDNSNLEQDIRKNFGTYFGK